MRGTPSFGLAMLAIIIDSAACGHAIGCPGLSFAVDAPADLGPLAGMDVSVTFAEMGLSCRLSAGTTSQSICTAANDGSTLTVIEMTPGRMQLSVDGATPSCMKVTLQPLQGKPVDWFIAAHYGDGADDCRVPVAVNQVPACVAD